MSHTYSEFLPSYSAGVDCYKAIPEIVKPYGKKAVVVGGKTAMEKSKEALLEGIKGSDIEIIDFAQTDCSLPFQHFHSWSRHRTIQNQ